MKRLPRLAFAAALATAACQPLPHPFADDAPAPGAPILALPDNTSITIAPIAGEPRATAEKLAPAMARALQQHEIAASDKTASIDSWELSGTLTPMPTTKGKAAVMVLWQLRDSDGKPVAERAYALEARSRDWQKGDADAVAKLAAASAAQIAGLLLPEAAPVETEAGGRTRLYIAGVTGASGDGGRSLAASMAALLRRQDGIALIEDKAKADLLLDGEVTIAKPKAGKQNVKIVWHLRRRDGGEIGQVGQENDVPAGLLDGSWGDVAYMVAMSAQDGIMQLVERGAPEPTVKTGEHPAARAGG